MSLLGIDIGSTGCKTALYTDEGLYMGGAYREYQIHMKGEYAELNPEIVWHSAVSCIRETVAVHKDRVKALSVSSMTDTFIPIGHDGLPLMDSIMSFDARAQAETREIASHISPRELHEITGMPLHPMHPACKILWLRKHRPKLADKVWKYLCYEDYMLWKLGAEPGCSFSTAGRFLLFNNSEQRWDRRLMSLIGVEEDQLPAVHPSGRMAGTISKEAAEATGLPPKTILITGGFDQACCACACGVFEKGQVADTTGTNEILFFIADENQREWLYENNFSYSFHVAEGTFASFGHMFNAGGALKWYRNVFCDAAVSYDEITEGMPDEPTELYFLPFLSGMGTPEMRPELRGAFYGLSLDSGRQAISKAILEGVCMELKFNLDLLGQFARSKNTVVKALGGGAKSEAWLQLKADITGTVIEGYPDLEAGAAGAAILAGTGCGVFGNVQQGYQAFDRFAGKKIYEPRGDRLERYTEKYVKYCKLRENLKRL